MDFKAGNALAVWVGLNAGGASFIGVWAYGMMSTDWVRGLLFGWIPALIIGVIAGLAAFALTRGVTGLMAPQALAPKTPPADPPAGIPAQ